MQLLLKKGVRRRWVTCWDIEGHAHKVDNAGVNVGMGVQLSEFIVEVNVGVMTGLAAVIRRTLKEVVVVFNSDGAGLAGSWYVTVIAMNSAPSREAVVNPFLNEAL